MANNANYEGNRRQLCNRIRMLSHGHARANERVAELEDQIQQLRQQRQARPNDRLIRQLQIEINNTGARMVQLRTQLNEANRQLEASEANTRRLEASEARWHQLFRNARRAEMAGNENAQQLTIAQNTINAFQRQVEIIANDQGMAYFTELQASQDPFLLGVGLDEYDARNLVLSDDEPEEVALDDSDDEPEDTALPKGELKLRKRKAEQKFGYSFSKYAKKF